MGSCSTCFLPLDVAASASKMALSAITNAVGWKLWAFR